MTARPEAEIGDEFPTALYRLYGTDGALLYVGVTNNLQARFGQHADVKPWWDDVARKTVTWYDSRRAALDAEVLAIRDERPIHNVQKALTSVERGGGRRTTPGADRHKETPMSLRLPADLKAWLVAYSKETGRPMRSVILHSIAEYRRHADLSKT